MITIQNISEQTGKNYGVGTQDYVLRINQTEIVKFQANFGSLEGCLILAAKAVAKKKWTEAWELLKKK